MFLFIVLFWFLDNGKDRIPGSAELIPDWAVVNSPVRTATGNGSQEVDFTDRFRVKTAPETGKSKKIPASTGKTGNPIPRGHVPGWPSAPALAGAARCRYSRLVRPGELKE